MVDAIKRANSAEPAKIREALAATKDFLAVTGKTSCRKSCCNSRDEGW